MKKGTRLQNVFKMFSNLNIANYYNNDFVKGGVVEKSWCGHSILAHAIISYAPP